MSSETYFYVPLYCENLITLSKHNIMKRMTRHFTAVMLMLLLAPLATMAQEIAGEGEGSALNDSVDRMDPDFVTASICIADPTDWRDDMLGVLGHAFIRLQCPRFNLDYCFSYEGQSANDDILGLLTGNLKMGLFAANTAEYIKPYFKWNRTVREYSLNLPPDAEQRLWQIMDRHLEEGMDIPLDLTEHGCVQTIVQNVIQALDTTRIEYGEWPAEYQHSRYEILSKQLEPYPWLRLLAKCLGMYGDFDKDCSNEEKIILPYQLVEVWQNATIHGEPFLTYKCDLVKGASPTVERPWFTPTVALLVAILLIVIILLVRKWKNSK